MSNLAIEQAKDPLCRLFIKEEALRIFERVGNCKPHGNSVYITTSRGNAYFVTQIGSGRFTLNRASERNGVKTNKIPLTKYEKPQDIFSMVHGVPESVDGGQIIEKTINKPNSRKKENKAGKGTKQRRMVGTAEEVAAVIESQDDYFANGKKILWF